MQKYEYFNSLGHQGIPYSCTKECFDSVSILDPEHLVSAALFPHRAEWNIALGPINQKTLF